MFDKVFPFHHQEFSLWMLQLCVHVALIGLNITLGELIKDGHGHYYERKETRISDYRSSIASSKASKVFF